MTTTPQSVIILFSCKYSRISLLRCPAYGGSRYTKSKCSPSAFKSDNAFLSGICKTFVFSLQRNDSIFLRIT